MKELVLEVKDLKKSYGSNNVLKGMSFNVRRGQIFSLLGSNGAGKTTAVRILATLLKADEGEIKICGYDLRKEPHKVRECISLTGQYAAVDENLTGRENLLLIGELRCLKDKKYRADKLLKTFELADTAERRVKTYSGGMRRKLDLAMSLMGHPRIIFLDEPTTGLDPQSRLALWKIIKDLSAKGITIFLTTQYLQEAEHLADFVAVLNEGVIVSSGTVNEMKKLLPSRIVELGFSETEHLEKAMQLLEKFNPRIDNEEQTLSFIADDGIKKLSDALNILQKAEVEVAKLEKKSPSLEDVFLALINKKEN